MAVNVGLMPITAFEQWYEKYDPTGGRNGCLEVGNVSDCGMALWRLYQNDKREMDLRVANYEKLEMLAAGEVISPKPDLPNVSSGETAGLVRRITRSLVQNTPNVEVISTFNDDDINGIFTKFLLTSKIIGSDGYSNDMQQNLSASAQSALTLGFDCVLPVLLEDAAGSWYMKYDAIHYRDVFPESGCKDVRDASHVFIRRYLTKGEVHALIRDNAVGWDIDALKLMAQTRPPSKEQQSVDHQTKKHHQIPEGYEIITWYSNTGDPFLTFDARNKMLLRIEINKHPLKQHPVHFLVLEKDAQQPLGRSMVEQLVGRQDFQDLMLNGAMKLWYRNINPSIIGYGTVNSVPNLSPGKYTQISNPNAKIEPFEVNTQTLMQYSTISEQNLGSMVNLVGAPDQQMAQSAGNGMSATPQGVDAQAAVVDLTTNNYQKAIEAFFSHYCSYALTVFLQEMKAVKKVSLTADTRIRLLEAGFPTEELNDDGTLDMDFANLAVQYWVRCVPGSLVEMEDEKQLRVLNQLFIPLSQAMPALAQTGDQQMIGQAAKAMQYIVGKQLELSGASAAKEVGLIWSKGDVETVDARDARIAELEAGFNGLGLETDAELETNAMAIAQLQEQMSLMIANQQKLLEQLGVMQQPSADSSPTPAADVAPVAVSA